MKKQSFANIILAGTLIVTCSFKLNHLQFGGNSGLYLTALDYVSHKLTYGFDCNSSDGKLQLNELFGNSSGYIVSKGEKHAFDKNKTFGYQICDSKVYRLFDKYPYEILDTAGFYLYYRYNQVEKIKGKELIKTDEYYFSKDAGSPIELLTAENLKQAFPDNLKFHYALDAQFKTNQELIGYDSYAKCYKLKYVYYQSLK
jgi:hypothetical protein